MNSKVSVITVCYNAAKTISKTIESILQLSYRPLQYIIIDGNSKDGTLESVNAYAKKFEEKNIEFKIISEPDKGIYNAMNKGVLNSDGDWIIFMNADDSFYSSESITELAQELSNYNIDIIYGNENVFDDNGVNTTIKRDADIYKIMKNLPFCHQSSLTRRELFIKHPFDESLEIVGDYEFFLYWYLMKANFKYKNTVIASYYKNGASRKCYNKAIDEIYSVKDRYGIINSKKIGSKIKRKLRKIYTGLQIMMNR